MARIFHVADGGALAAALASGTYRGSTAGQGLDDAGFVHCAYGPQLAGVIERFYPEADELVILEIDTDLVTEPVVDEAGEGDERFPHVYGPLAMGAVVHTVKLRRAGGRFALDGLLSP